MYYNLEYNLFWAIMYYIYRFKNISLYDHYVEDVRVVHIGHGIFIPISILFMKKSEALVQAISGECRA